jgi:hypothetical protein
MKSGKQIFQKSDARPTFIPLMLIALVVGVLIIVSRSGLLKDVPPVVMKTFFVALPGIFFILRGQIIVGVMVSIIYFFGRQLELSLSSFDQTLPGIIGALALIVGYYLGELVTRWLRSARSH